MRLFLAFLALLPNALFGQGTLPYAPPAPTGLSVPVTLVSAVTSYGAKSGGGTGVALSGTPTGTQGCAASTWCGFYPQATASLTGNFGLIYILYTNGSSATLTVKIGTQTLTLGPITTIESGKFLAAYYGANLTFTTGQPYTINDGGTGIVIDWVRAEEWAGIATSSPIRSSAGNQAATNTTFTGSSVTTTTGDLVAMLGCAVGTPARTSFTAGSGFAKESGGSDISTYGGCMVQSEVVGSGSTFTPTMTTAPTSTFAAVTLDIKPSTTSGTLQTGMYPISAEEIGTNIAEAAAGSTSFEIPSTGNTGLISMACGNYVLSGVTDSQQSGGAWKALTPETLDNGSITSMAVGQNLSADSNGAVSISFVTPSGSNGDCDGYFYDIAGGATASLGDHIQISGTQGSAGNLTFFSGWTPEVSSGLAFATVSQASNTTVALTAPSGASALCAYFSGQNTDGPSLPCQNNTQGMFPVSSNASNAWTQKFTTSTEAAGAWTAEGVGLLASGGTFGPFSPTQIAGETISGTGSSTTMTPGGAITTLTHDTIAIGLVWNGSSTTVSSCGDNVNAGSYSVASGPQTGTGSGITGQRMELLYLTNVTGGATTVTCHFSATITSANAYMYVAAIRGVTTGLDLAPAIAHPGSTSTLSCTATGTLNHSPEYAFVLGFIGNAFQMIAATVTINTEDSSRSFGDAGAGAALGTTSSYTANFNANTLPSPFMCGIATFY